MQRLFEIRAKSGRLHLVNDSQLVFTPKGGKSVKFSVQETHALLNFLFDYRRTIIHANLEFIRGIEKQHRENMSHAQQQRAKMV